ncbi:hypothetical protein RJ639_021227 [Escallonia herrerae]|uniref:ABC1 atypical kinase-like domain-containing protein n=1 Tax=Escallonia herrerae TaxID=1293975 RepID=A0AA88V5X5_9ASTE|nr:hypothetical protein RJ639_021227 [Escallonia herrerae]
MATTSLSTSTLPELTFLRPPTTHKFRPSLSKLPLSKLPHFKPSLSIRIRAAQRDETTLVEERESELLNGMNGNGSYSYNGSAGKYTNGVVGVIESKNGSLVKYLDGNGNGNGVAAVRIAEEVVVEKIAEGSGRKKKSVEEIGQEDAWFKKSAQDQVQGTLSLKLLRHVTLNFGLELRDAKWNQVSVAPGGRWSRFKTYSTIQRTLEIWGFVLKFIVKVWLSNQKFSYRGGMTEAKKVLRRKALAKWLKESILRLGPTFIKIGQQFSTRVDILAQEYVDQLSELQVISEYLQKIDPKSDGAKRDWVAIYDECANVLYQVEAAATERCGSILSVWTALFGDFSVEFWLESKEIDYTKEAANAELFASNFKNMDYVKVPEIYWDYTTPQVLTMEYVPGIKINRIQALDQLGVDRQRLGRYAVESYLEQILSHGFFHADPHPGNIAVDDYNGGRLIFYDFGMMGSISPNIREGLLETFYGVYEKDPNKVLQAMIQMGVLVPTGDMTAVRRTAQFFLNSFEERLAAQRKERELATAELGFKKPLSKEEKIEKKKQRLAAIGEDLLAIAADQPFRFPATFTFVVRAFSVLDGIGKGLDPRFDITEIAKPYALELLKFREAGVEDFRKRWERQSRAFYNLFRQADRVEKLAEIIQRLAVAAGSLINLATILYLNSIRGPAMIAYLFCAFFGFQVLFGTLKVKKFDQRERLITGTA